jgi:hypothetical protein
MIKPKYLYRPSDFEIFELDGEEYVMKCNDGFLFHHHYTYKSLMDHGFLPCVESDFEELSRKHKLYRDYIMWSSRPDGHGGRKGGTMKEYLKIFK